MIMLVAGVGSNEHEVQNDPRVGHVWTLLEMACLNQLFPSFNLASLVDQHLSASFAKLTQALRPGANDLARHVAALQFFERFVVSQ